jgi:hypothetical protein
MLPPVMAKRLEAIQPGVLPEMPAPRRSQPAAW